MYSPPSQMRHPYGITDLDSRVLVDEGTQRYVKCFVLGCHHWLKPPTRNAPGDLCPVHEIYCHGLGGRGTYSYRNPVRNIIAGQHAFQTKILGHPFKLDTRRFGLERSEDALTWNVFRALYESSLLPQVVEMFTKERCVDRPELFLWGLSMHDFQPWAHLIAARQRFESSLPVQRPLTEPDIAIHIPGKYVILIEAKFTSPNTFYEPGIRKDSQSLTQEELLEIYHFPEGKILDREAARKAPRVPQQLWRNMVFAEYIAHLDSPRTKAIHVNLVRREAEPSITAEFGKWLRHGFERHFQRWTWEDIYHQVALAPSLQHLGTYMQNKTAGLHRAFQLG